MAAAGRMRRGAVLASFVVLVGCGGGTVTSSGSAAGGDGTDGGRPGNTADGSVATADGGTSAPICSSGATWTRGDHGSAEMNPGRACLACHATMHGPALSIAGTVYPTAHEPDLCDGADLASGGSVVITGADGQTLMLQPNAAGNFETGAHVAIPFTAKITYAGRERAMSDSQTSGDCNGCHTQDGASGAPGRIMLP